jgi:hypothetical protein
MCQNHRLNQEISYKFLPIFVNDIMNLVGAEELLM